MANEQDSGLIKENAIRTDTLPLSSDRIEEESQLCDTLILENSDEETPEHISDFLSSIMSNPSQEGEGDEFSDEQESTFTMPTSFDIPQEYISEMVPRASSTVSNPFQTSDEEYSENLTSDLQSKVEDRDFDVKKEGCSEQKVYEYSEPNVKEEERKEETKLKHEKDIKVENVDKVFPSGNSLSGGKNEAATSSTLQVKGEVEQITYQKSMGHKKFKEKKTHNPKMDRRTLQAKLFGESDSEGEGRKKERKKKEHEPEKGEQKKVKGVEIKGQSDSEISKQRLSETENSKKHNPVETKEDLEQKKRRMKKKLKQAEAEQRRESEKSKVSKESSKESSKNKEKKLEKEQRGSPQKSKKPGSEHECHSMCSCVKRALNAGEDDWLVPDTQVTYRTSSSDSDTPLPSVKVLDKKPKKVNIGDSSTEDGDQDEDSADEEEQRKLEAERKVALALRGGGDVLSRMRGKLSVKIQNSPKFVVIDLWQYQAQLDASDTSGSDYRKPTAG